jgi:hypothetical protein
MTRCFFYGTLLDAATRRRAAGRAVKVEPAWLDDHVVLKARGRLYPIIWPRAGNRAQGALSEPLDARAIAALTRYEGHEYHVVDVTVMTAAGPVAARMFAPLPDRIQPTRIRWRLETWRVAKQRSAED